MISKTGENYATKSQYSIRWSVYLYSWHYLSTNMQFTALTQAINYTTYLI